MTAHSEQSRRFLLQTLAEDTHAEGGRPRAKKTDRARNRDSACHPRSIVHRRSVEIVVVVVVGQASVLLPLVKLLDFQGGGVCLYVGCVVLL